jgi:hypothetical protein
LDINQELSEYLMSNLVDSYSDFDDDSTFAFATLVNITLLGDTISESMLNLYTAPVKQLIGSEMLSACVSYFHGAQILSVSCDCHEPSTECVKEDMEESPWLEQGRLDASSGAPLYNKATTEIMVLREAIF